MTFIDLKQSNIDSTLGWHTGEIVDYRAFPAAPIQITAHVKHDVFTDDGIRLSNMVEVEVSRTSVPQVSIGRDSVDVVFPKGSGTKRTFDVLDVIQGSNDETYYRLRCKLR